MTRPEEGPPILCPSVSGEPAVRFTLCLLCVHPSVSLTSVSPLLLFIPIAFWLSGLPSA